MFGGLTQVWHQRPRRRHLPHRYCCCCRRESCAPCAPCQSWHWNHVGACAARPLPSACVAASSSRCGAWWWALHRRGWFPHGPPPPVAGCWHRRKRSEGCGVCRRRRRLQTQRLAQCSQSPQSWHGGCVQAGQCSQSAATGAWATRGALHYCCCHRRRRRLRGGG